MSFLLVQEVFAPSSMAIIWKREKHESVKELIIFLMK